MVVPRLSIEGGSHDQVAIRSRPARGAEWRLGARLRDVLVGCLQYCRGRWTRHRRRGQRHFGRRRKDQASSSAVAGTKSVRFHGIDGRRANLGPVRNGATFLVLDTAPNADQAASLAARAADLVLIPCRPARFDLEAIETTLLLTRAAGKPADVVLNAVPPRGEIGREATDALAAQGRPDCRASARTSGSFRTWRDRRTDGAGV
jgi:hypothetical protein